MSPAYSEDENDIFSWLGCIHYIPTQNENERKEISESFRKYSRIMDQLCDKHNAIGHWAKIETSNLNENEIEKCKNRIKRYYGERLDLFQKYRNEFDPKGLLGNDVIDVLFN